MGVISHSQSPRPFSNCTIVLRRMVFLRPYFLRHDGTVLPFHNYRGHEEHYIPTHISGVRRNASPMLQYFSFNMLIHIISHSIRFALPATQPNLDELITEFFLQPQISRKSEPTSVLTLPTSIHLRNLIHSIRAKKLIRAHTPQEELLVIITNYLHFSCNFFFNIIKLHISAIHS